LADIHGSRAKKEEGIAIENKTKQEVKETKREKTKETAQNRS